MAVVSFQNISCDSCNATETQPTDKEIKDYSLFSADGAGTYTCNECSAQAQVSTVEYEVYQT